MVFHQSFMQSYALMNGKLFGKKALSDVDSALLGRALKGVQ